MGTVVDYRREQSKYTKFLHKMKVKEFYLVVNNGIQKYIIPEKYRGNFKEEYDPINGSFKDTAEFIELIAKEYESFLTIMDFEIENFINDLKDAKDNDGYDLTEDWI